MSIVLPEIKYFSTDKNLKIIYLYHESSLFFCEIDVRVGSRNEDRGSHGLAHFFEHMIFKGLSTETDYIKTKSDKINSNTTIAECIDYIGATSNASTSIDKTNYYISGLNNEYEFILRTLLQMLFEPQFPEEAMKNELSVVLEEYQMRQDNINLQFFFETMKALYENIDDKIYMDPIGTKDDILSITRDKLIDFHHDKYLDGEKTMIIIGNVSEKDVLRVIKTMFPKIEPWTPEFISWEKELIIDNYKRIIKPLLYIDLPYQQSVVKMCFRSVNYYSSWIYTGETLASILGTRLFTLLRNTMGLTYYQYASQELYNDYGYFIIEFGVKYEGIQSAIFTIMNLLFNFECSEYELQKVKNHIERSIVTDTESIVTIGSNVINYIIGKKDPNVYACLRNKYASVKTKHINNFAKKIFKKENMCVLIGGHKDELKHHNVVIDQY